jgi:hypothetical protein
MKLTIENTTRIVEVNGIPCRMWEGVSERGVKVQCLITRVAVLDTDDTQQFEAELQETKPPTAESMAYPLRLIL